MIIVRIRQAGGAGTGLGLLATQDKKSPQIRPAIFYYINDLAK